MSDESRKPSECAMGESQPVQSAFSPLVKNQPADHSDGKGMYGHADRHPSVLEAIGIAGVDTPLVAERTAADRLYAEQMSLGTSVSEMPLYVVKGIHGALLFLLKLGEMTERDSSPVTQPGAIPIWDVGASIAMSAIEAEAIASDLQEQSLIAYSSLAGDITLTELGRSELALLYARPDSPTARFPALTSLLEAMPVSVIEAHTDTTGRQSASASSEAMQIGGASAGGHQGPVITDPSQSALKDFLGQLEACCGDLAFPVEEADSVPDNDKPNTDTVTATDIPLDTLASALERVPREKSDELIEELTSLKTSLS